MNLEQMEPASKFSWLDDFDQRISDSQQKQETLTIDVRKYRQCVLQTSSDHSRSFDQKESHLGRSFAFAVSDCPESLKLFVKFYRWIGFSFSGITFVDEGSKQIADTVPPGLKSALFLSINLFFLCVSLFPYFISQKTADLSSTNSTSYTNTTLEYELALSLAEFKRGFIDFKPILRVVMEFIIYVFTVDGLVNYTVSFFAGGRLVREFCHLAQLCRGSESFDQKNRSLGKRLLLGNFGLIILIYIIAISAFSSRQVKVIAVFLFGSGLFGQTPSPEELQLAKRMFTVLLIHSIYFVIQSMAPILFIYTMTLFSEQIEQIALQATENGEELDERKLLRIKLRLVSLANCFRRILGHFSLPLTVTNVTNIYLTISAACFLMVANGQQRHFCAFVFIFGLFGLMRLILVCWAGNLATNAYRELVRQLYEQVPEWSLSTWLCFTEIKRIQVKFRATILDTYTVHQSALLTMLGFALNYIVVLLQTENYGSASNGQKMSNAAVKFN